MNGATLPLEESNATKAQSGAKSRQHVIKSLEIFDFAKFGV